jgi:hypothetical protein
MSPGGGGMSLVAVQACHVDAFVSASTLAKFPTTSTAALATASKSSQNWAVESEWTFQTAAPRHCGMWKTRRTTIPQ